MEENPTSHEYVNRKSTIIAFSYSYGYSYLCLTKKTANSSNFLKIICNEKSKAISIKFCTYVHKIHWPILYFERSLTHTWFLNIIHWSLENLAPQIYIFQMLTHFIVKYFENHIHCYLGCFNLKKKILNIGYKFKALIFIWKLKC